MSRTPPASSRRAALTDATERWSRPDNARCVLLVLTLANALAFVDRQGLAPFVEPIKADLGVSDTAISLLYGMSFTLIYVTVGVPVGRFADRANRRNVIAGSIVVWSLAIAACGLTRSFAGLFAARLCIGAGEAGLNPAAYSMLADCFPRERLAAAIGVYQTGIYLGGAAALLGGGFNAGMLPAGVPIMLPLGGKVKGWHIVVLALGAPELALSALLFALREPVRRGAPRTDAVVPLSTFFAHVVQRREAYVGIGLAFALKILVGNSTGAWIMTPFVRKFGWTTAEIGARYGLTVFVCGSGGALAGGVFASWLERRGLSRGNLVAALIGFVALLPLTIGFPLVPTAWPALAMIGAMNFFAGFNFGGGLATLQNMTPNRMRALLAASYMVFANVVGAALGPTVVALVTDYGFGDPQRLPDAIAITCAVASPLAVLCLLIGMRGLAHVQRLDTAGPVA
ncbi:MFS transporter [Sphingomonas sp. LB3N6]|uniref:MFS transporter n=1 Tax=Sphingomonas fucosidasi TaxID=3096164 RepID=UPI002FC813A6